MNIAIIGLGYVGATTAAVLASWGHEIYILDKDNAKCDRYLQGLPDVHEVGLSELIENYGSKIKKISSYSDILKCDIAFICVNTPYKDQDLDLTNVKSVLDELNTLSKSQYNKLEIAIRSTVSPNIIEDLKDFDEAFTSRIFLNPEFLREGAAIEDFNNPPKVVIGTNGSKPEKLISLYEHLNCELFILSFFEVTLTKLIDNSWHAVKVSFGNEIGAIINRLGLNVERALEPFFADTKLNISSKYLKPGNAFGGSCLTKDLSGLSSLAEKLATPNILLSAVKRSNDEYIEKLAFDIIEKASESNCACIVIHGIAFKLNTNDLRESPNIKIGAILASNKIDVIYTDAQLYLSTLPIEQIRIAELMDPDFSRKFRDLADLEEKYDMIVCNKRNLPPPGTITSDIIFEI